MFQLTSAAGKQLHQSLLATRAPEEDDKCFRVVPKDEATFTLKYCTPVPGDAVYEHDGEAVLALPKALQGSLNDLSLDVDGDGKLRLC